MSYEVKTSELRGKNSELRGKIILVTGAQKSSYRVQNARYRVHVQNSSYRGPKV